MRNEWSIRKWLATAAPAPAPMRKCWGKQRAKLLQKTLDKEPAVDAKLTKRRAVWCKRRHGALLRKHHRGRSPDRALSVIPGEPAASGIALLSASPGVGLESQIGPGGGSTQEKSVRSRRFSSRFEANFTKGEWTPRLQSDREKRGAIGRLPGSNYKGKKTSGADRWIVQTAFA